MFKIRIDCILQCNWNVWCEIVEHLKTKIIALCLRQITMKTFHLQIVSTYMNEKLFPPFEKFAIRNSFHFVVEFSISPIHNDKLKIVPSIIGMQALNSYFIFLLLQFGMFRYQRVTYNFTNDFLSPLWFVYFNKCPYSSSILVIL